MAPDTTRNPDLDGLRGLAAMSVALGHCYLQATGLTLWASSLKDFHAMPGSQVVARVLAALFPSDAAVVVFFVLSGHVLWSSFRRKDMRFFRDLPDYAASRLYRLLPLAIVTAVPFGFMVSVPASELARNMLLFSNSVNGVLWSLQVEMAGSAMLFLLWGLTKGRARKLLLALLLSIAVLPFCRGNPLVMFLPAFILGAGVSAVPAWVFSGRWLLAAGIAALILSNVFLGHGGIDRCVEMGAATMLVGAVSQGRLPFLRRRVPIYLGAISYPFYLIHPLGLMIAQQFLGALSFSSPYATVAIYALLSIPPTIVGAWLLHVLVEAPAQRGRPRIAWPFLVRRFEGSGTEGIALEDDPSIGVPNNLALKTWL